MIIFHFLFLLEFRCLRHFFDSREEWLLTNCADRPAFGTQEAHFSNLLSSLLEEYNNNYHY